MNARRLFASSGVEFLPSFRRPLFLALMFFLALTAFGLSTGNMQISSGSSSVGGTKAWITSEFAQTQTMCYLTLLYHAFFIAAAAGLTLLRDRESRVDVLLHATPLQAGEYVWGRFLAVVGAFTVILLWQAIMLAFFNHAVPIAATEIRGAFALRNYLVPVFTIGLPFVVFYAGVAMYLGERTRSAVMVFVLPVATLLACGFFLWTWSPSWLGPGVNRILQALDPSAYRWLNETHLKVDRGVAFYNTAAVPYDGLFWLNRMGLLALGLGAVALTQRAVARSLRGEVVREHRWLRRRPAAGNTVPSAVTGEATVGPLRALGMRGGTPGFLATVRAVAGSEARELRRQAGLYVFVPLILIQALGTALTALGAFDTPILLTSGLAATGIASQTGLLVCLLLMFYTVEALERERACGLAPVLYATPLRTSALLAGKALANGLVAALVLLASLVACVIAIIVQGKVGFSPTPFLLVWGLLLVPTFLAWVAFVTAAWAAVGNRYGAYAVSLGALILTGWKALTGKLNWAGNWPLWGAFRWSDLGFYETDRAALVLNRVMVLGAAVFFAAVAVRLFARRGGDAARALDALAPRRVARTAVRMLPFAAVPTAACIGLAFMVHGGLEGGTARKEEHDYWAKNLKTWFEAPLPDIARLDVAVKMDPARHWLASTGSLTLVNPHETALAQLPLSGGRHWEDLTWTLNGRPCEPEDSERLYVFTPEQPLAPGDSLVIGWSFSGRFPGGVTRNGGNTQEFILPSGVVLTGFTPSFLPVVGFQEGRGEEEKNTPEPRRHPRDYHLGVTRAGYGATAWFPARLALTGPEGYTFNGPGSCVADSVRDGWRTQVWQTDHPVKIVNIVGGRWLEKRGEASVVHYHPGHAYNVEEMSATLDQARRWYSEWFAPYPWRDLRLSEFPGLAGYAQGFGTNITFSENIGFLTRNTAATDATFLVTAHEAAHQWWGNILTPANGPGGDILSEGAAHFATLLLFEQVKGPRGRMEFAKGIEARYNDRRHPDDERPMYDVDGKRRHDSTVLYDRGGWVFWMVYDYLGPERAVEAYRDFFRTWSQGRDHPALQDFVALMRTHAPDPVAFDAFARQWFEDKAMPQYRVAAARKQPLGGEWEVTATVTNSGTGTMPVEVAATAGERWREPAGGDVTGRWEQDPAYREARSTIVLGAGESRDVTIRCGFEPERVVVDPDVRVLQLQRKLATAGL